ncbi:MAG TPA: sodium:proton antiporter [Ktedonobacterales bacterium]
MEAGVLVLALNSVEVVVLLLVVTLAVALAARGLRVPYTLALVVVGLVLGMSGLLPRVRLDPVVVLFVFLPLLLFEGAWSMRLAQLLAEWAPVALLALPGLLISIVVTALVVRAGIGLAWPVALLLGAMVSPTDPVAVLALLRQLDLPERLRALVEGESLFNDGLGAAAFTMLLALAVAAGAGQPAASPWSVALGALWLMLGGVAIGTALGLVAALALRAIDDYLIETMATVCVAYGAYVLADLAHASGLLAVICAGFVMGNYGRRTAMSARTRAVTEDVWEVAGYLANSLLFLLLGVQIGAHGLLPALAGIAWAVLGVLMGRAAMIYVLLPLYNVVTARWPGRGRWARRRIPRAWGPLLLFSGLRGALSLALVLSLPASLAARPLLESIVYGVVLVTLVGQGIGLRIVLPLWAARGDQPAPPAPR